jgi:hypothetical protein
MEKKRMTEDKKAACLECLECPGFPCDAMVLDRMSIYDAWIACQNKEKADRDSD